MYTYKAKLDRVVDGDTVDAMIDLGFDTWVKRRIRFMGVDTWECRTRNKEEKVKGLAAKARTTELLTEVTNKPNYFRLKSHGVGKYGRVLGNFMEDYDLILSPVLAKPPVKIGEIDMSSKDFKTYS